MISKSQEDYLKAMYVLKMKNGEIRVTDIAQYLNISKPSVTKAINNMKEIGLVNNETYGKIELTEQGIDIAKKVLEAYDISYVFLKDVLWPDFKPEHIDFAVSEYSKRNRRYGKIS